jgi:hypothetical protein
MITGSPLRQSVPLDLPLFRPLDKIRSQIRLNDLLRALSDGRWHTAKELKVHGFTDRELRMVVEEDQAGDIFSFPGSPGYKLWKFVTEEEFLQSKALLNQGRAMIRRWLRYQRRHHRGTR